MKVVTKILILVGGLLVLSFSALGNECVQFLNPMNVANTKTLKTIAPPHKDKLVQDGLDPILGYQRGHVNVTQGTQSGAGYRLISKWDESAGTFKLWARVTVHNSLPDVLLGPLQIKVSHEGNRRFIDLSVEHNGNSFVLRIEEERNGTTRAGLSLNVEYKGKSVKGSAPVVFE